MAFLGPMIFIDLILPLMMQDRTGIVGLTTPKGEKKQFFKHLMRAKDKEGNPIFLKLQNKEACDACKELNKADTCPHEVYSRSTNKTAKSMEKARLVYGDEYAMAGNEELLGMDTDERGSIIPMKDIEAFQSNVIKMDKPPRCVYLSIDPGGGGKNSEMGIVIAAEVVGPYGVKIALLNVTGYPVKLETAKESEETACERIIEWISLHPLLRGLPIIVIVEAAPATASSYIIGHLQESARRHRRNLIFMSEAKNDIGQPIPGIFKNGVLQEAYRYNLQIVLAQRYLAYEVNIGTLRMDHSGQQELARLAEMLSYYHWDEKLEAITSKGFGVDDIQSALSQMLYFAQVFWTKEYYRLQRQVIVSKSGMDFPFPGSGNNLVRNFPAKGKRKRL